MRAELRDHLRCVERLPRLLELPRRQVQRFRRGRIKRARLLGDLDDAFRRPAALFKERFRLVPRVVKNDFGKEVQQLLLVLHLLDLADNPVQAGPFFSDSHRLSGGLVRRQRLQPRRQFFERVCVELR